MNQEQARKRIKDLKDFYSHLASYVVVHIFLVTLNLFVTTDHLWVFYSLGGWGIGLAIHAFDVFGTSKGWEERKMQELTGWKDTQDELERLRERTEVLLSILTNVSWERIDPELLDTRDNLKSAQENIVRLRDQMDGNNDIDRQKIVREIEKLEAFVTSPRFQFLDKAQQ
jgi:hypothetical protein